MKRAGRATHPTFATRHLPSPTQELSALVTGIDILDRRGREREREGCRCFGRSGLGFSGFPFCAGSLRLPPGRPRLNAFKPSSNRAAEIFPAWERV